MTRVMKDSGIKWIGRIPKNWNIVRFKYLHLGLNVGESIDKEFWCKEATSNSIKFYTAGLVPINTIYPNFPEWKIVKSNDLLLARNGNPYVYLPYEGAAYSDHIIRATIKDIYDKRYIRYCLQSSISNEIVDSVSLATWSASIWNEQYMPFIDFNEQQRIASFLDSKCQEIDNVLAKTRSSIEEYKKLKQAIITKAVTKGIRKNRKMKDSGIEWIGEIPEEWSVYKIKYVTMFNPSVNTKGLEADSIVTFTPMECIYNGYFEPKETTLKMMSSSYTPYEEGDIVIAKVTPCFENGNIAIMENLKSGVGFGSSELFVLRPTVCNTKFLFYWLQNTIFKQNGCSTMTGTGGLKRVSPYFVKNSFVLCPDIEEQCVITKYLDSKCSAIDILISKKEQLISELETYKKSLIYEYVTGKKEVPMA